MRYQIHYPMSSPIHQLPALDKDLEGEQQREITIFLIYLGRALKK